MMKKRKNMQFLTAAALAAVLVTSQISFATVMGDNTSVLQMYNLIPDNVTIEKPIPLSEIELPQNDYGVLTWADDSQVPTARVQSYDVVFYPYEDTDLSKIEDWDGESDVIFSSITVVVSSISKDKDHAGEDEKQSDNVLTYMPDDRDVFAEDKELEQEENPEDTLADLELSEDLPEAEDIKASSEDSDGEGLDESLVDETFGEGVCDTENEKENVGSENTEVTDVSESSAEQTLIDENNIFDDAETEEAEDERVQTVDENLSDEEKAQIAEINHTCNGISVSGINLPWYVQFRAVSGEHYEFSNEAEANVFKSYEFELWDLRNDSEYEIPDGEYLSVTIPVKAGYDYTIEHLLDSGATETIVPSVEGSTMIFSTHSFSPFGIAGSKALVGEEIEDGSYSLDSSSESTVTDVSTEQEDSSDSSAADQVESDEEVSDAKTNSLETDVEEQSADTESLEDSSGDSVNSVDTGDDTPVIPFVILGAAAVVIIGVLVYLKKRK